MAAAVMLGAEGVLMGTRFYASVEADGHPEAKRRIVEAMPGATVRSTLFDIARRSIWPEPYTGRVAVEYTAARARGDFDMAGVIAGEACV